MNIKSLEVRKTMLLTYQHTVMSKKTYSYSKLQIYQNHMDYKNIIIIQIKFRMTFCLK